MARDRTTGFSNQELEAFRSQQEEMLNLSQEYSRSRLDSWNREIQQMQESWSAFSRDWQSSLEEMSSLGQASFDNLAARGEAAGNSLSQSLRRALGEITGDLEAWVDNFLSSLEKVNQSWSGILGNSGGGSWLSWLGSGLGFGGLFHQGGIISAHQGLNVSPGAWGSDERLILAQSGEGILPRDSMARLGEQNFEALRSGQFELAPRGRGTQFDVTIQVQTLDAAGANRVDWDRLVQRHILPLLEKEADRRW